MSSAQIVNLTKRFGGTTALEDFDLEVSDGEVLVLLGPSGCGKTTLLRSIAGMERPDSGGDSPRRRIGLLRREGVLRPSAPPPCGDGIPKLRPLAAHERL